MTTKVTTTEKGQHSLFCQASFNSDGNITLRNYNLPDKSEDEIIVLSAEETKAVIDLFRKMHSMIHIDESPF
jgi:hypothetical protein